jgi:hypothetical protein
MKSKKLMLFATRVAVVAAVVLVATLPLAAQGARHHLKRTYFSTGEQACLVSPLGFTNQVPNNVALAFVQSSSVQGTYRFHADGTGTAQFKELLITHSPATNASATSSEQSFSFTYALADDGTLTLISGPVSGTILTGSLKGVNVTLINFPLMSGRIERNGTTIMLSTTDPTIEMLTLELPNPLVLPRICHRMRVLMPVHVDPAED